MARAHETPHNLAEAGPREKAGWQASCLEGCEYGRHGNVQLRESQAQLWGMTHFQMSGPSWAPAQFVLQTATSRQ